MSHKADLILIPQDRLDDTLKRLHAHNDRDGGLSSNRDALLASIREQANEAYRLVDALDADPNRDRSLDHIIEELRAVLRDFVRVASGVHKQASHLGQTSALPDKRRIARFETSAAAAVPSKR